MTEESIAVIVERISNLDQKVANGQERAEKWREHFDAKLDNRPCVAHGKFLSSVGIQLKGIWFLIGVLLTAAILEFIKK
jgi:hypothetical protein